MDDLTKRIYETTHDPLVLALTIRRCHEEGVPPPEWTVAALERLAPELARKRPGSGMRSPEEKSNQLMTDFMRWLIVWALRRYQRTPYRQVFQAAADEIADIPEFACGEAAMRHSYRRFNRIMGW